jgi:hypothetical protein
MKNTEMPISAITHKGYPSDASVITDNTLIGLTKREYFATKAMQGLLSIYDNQNGIVPNEPNIKYVVYLAVMAADKLLKELEQTNNE